MNDTDPAPLGALILAGGLSRRMGRHKALYPLGPSTFLDTLLAAYTQADIRSLLVVTHSAVAGETDYPAADRVETLVLDQPTKSPLETLWRGLEAIEKRWKAFFMHPVDFPLVQSATLEKMAARFLEEQPAILQPRCRETGGHPLIFRMDLGEEIRAASPAIGLRQVVRQDPNRVHRLLVEDEGVLRGLNRPEDLYPR